MLGLVISLPGVVLTAVVMGLFLVRHFPLPKTAPYAGFVLAGAFLAPGMGNDGDPIVLWEQQLLPLREHIGSAGISVDRASAVD